MINRPAHRLQSSVVTRCNRNRGVIHHSAVPRACLPCRIAQIAESGRHRRRMLKSTVKVSDTICLISQMDLVCLASRPDACLHELERLWLASGRCWGQNLVCWSCLSLPSRARESRRCVGYGRDDANLQPTRSGRKEKKKGACLCD